MNENFKIKKAYPNLPARCGKSNTLDGYKILASSFC